jgi:hypothetical protein
MERSARRPDNSYAHSSRTYLERQTPMKLFLAILAACLQGYAFVDVLYRQISVSSVMCALFGGTIAGAAVTLFAHDYAHRKHSAELLERILEGSSGKP